MEGHSGEGHQAEGLVKACSEALTTAGGRWGDGEVIEVEEGSGGESCKASTWGFSEIWEWKGETWEGLKHKSDLVFLKDH